MIDDPIPDNEKARGSSEQQKSAPIPLTEGTAKSSKEQDSRRYARATWNHLKTAAKTIAAWIRRDSAYWTATATIAMAITTGIYTYYARKQWREMQDSGKQTDRLLCIYQQQLAQLSKQAGDTHDLATAAGTQAVDTGKLAVAAGQQARTGAAQLQVAYRPWVDFESVIAITSPIRGDFPPGGGHISFSVKFAIRNTGNAPAMNAVFEADAIVFNHDPKDVLPATKTEDYCKALKLEKGGHFSIFPGEIISRSNSINYYPTNSPEWGNGYFMPGIIACVLYKSPIDSEWHYTGRIFQVGQPFDPRSRVFNHPIFRMGGLPTTTEGIIIDRAEYPDATK